MFTARRCLLLTFIYKTVGCSILLTLFCACTSLHLHQETESRTLWMLIIYFYLVSVLAIFSQYQLMQLIYWEDSYLKYDYCMLSGLKEREREFICQENRTIIWHNKKYNGRLLEGALTPLMLATCVNITNNMDNERQTNRAKQSQQKTNKAWQCLVPSQKSVNQCK